MIFKFEIWIHCYKTDVFFALLTVGAEQMIQYLTEYGIWKSFNKIRISKILYSYMGGYLESDLANFKNISKFNERICNSLFFICLYLYESLKVIHLISLLISFNDELE